MPPRITHCPGRGEAGCYNRPCRPRGAGQKGEGGQSAMLWEIEIRPRGQDAERQRVCDEYRLLTHAGGNVVTAGSRGYLLEGDLDHDAAQRLLDELLLDPLVEEAVLGSLNANNPGAGRATVL